MRHWVRSHLTYANVVSTLALFLVLGGGSALAAYVVNSNDDIAPNTVAGHNPPAGAHANIITGSLAGSDLANQAVSQGKLKPAEAWREVNDFGSPGEPRFRTANSSPEPSGFCAQDGCIWTNFDSAHNTAGFYRDPFGQVHLKGLICRRWLPLFLCMQGKVDDLAAPVDDIFKLPAGYRPEKSIEFSTSAQGEFARLRIDPDGIVYADPPFNYQSFYLDNIHFRCFPSGQNGCP
jgi:hypothetical protein